MSKANVSEAAIGAVCAKNTYRLAGARIGDHLLALPGVNDAGVDIVYEPVWTPERMSEEARRELGMV